MLTQSKVRPVSRTSAALFGLAIAIAALPLVVPIFRFGGGLDEGDIASRTFEAPRNAQFVSEVLTEAARVEAANAVPDVPLPVDTALRDERVAALSSYLDSVEDILLTPGLSTNDRIERIGALESPNPIGLSAQIVLQSLDPSTFARFKLDAVAGLRSIMSQAVGAGETPEQQTAHLNAAVTSYLEANPAGTTAEGQAMGTMLRGFAAPNFAVDTEATLAARLAAREAVEPRVRTIAQGQVIVTEGQPIGAQEIEALKATGVITDGLDVFAAAGGASMAVALGLLLGVYAYLFQAFEAPTRRRMAAIGLTFFLTLYAVRIALPIVQPDTEAHFYAFALPVAVAAMMAASFSSLSFAALVAVAAGMFGAFVGGTAPQIAGSSYVGSLQALELGMTYTVAGLAGAATVHGASRLGRFGFSAVTVAFACAVVMMGFWLIGTPRANVELAWIGVAAGMHGFIAATLAAGLFILLSSLFGITSRLQLLELAQADHPLLRRLQDEAPGTYHHSMLVGALAERAAAQVRADSLVARAGAYYHDIGKLVMPGYYIENMQEGETSPHDALRPQESARIIRAHVTNGLELARKHRLPPVIRDFIPQHHGTRLVTYFYRQAAAEGERVDPAPFSYSGPRPQSREAAIVMLADSCEAVVRARRDEPGTTMEQIIDSVFAERLSEGQLDECDITMRELQAIAASFKATLRAVYHPRVQYPQPTPEEIASLARGETLSPNR
jgi:cyclic-di-AMP phosphodiesterase PgpH